MRSAQNARVPAAVLAAIAAAWAIAAAAQFSGGAAFLHHDALIERGPPLQLALLLFAAAWPVMIAAMMLPSSLPVIRTYALASANQPRSGAAIAAFIGGYAVVWWLFGIAAFCFDVALHRLVDRSPWLTAHPWFIAGCVLAAAGAFQFTPLKDACLHACRLPGTYVMRRYRRGSRAAFETGVHHGLFCAGCCWALMLVCFAAGFAALWWMVLLTALMVYEKTARRGREAVPVAGAALLAWSALVFAHVR